MHIHAWYHRGMQYHFLSHAISQFFNRISAAELSSGAALHIFVQAFCKPHVPLSHNLCQLMYLHILPSIRGHVTQCSNCVRSNVHMRLGNGWQLIYKSPTAMTHILPQLPSHVPFTVHMVSFIC